MTDNNADKIAALEKEVAALKAKMEPPPKSTFVPMSDAEWIDRMHQMRERRMSMATPPSVVRDWNVLDNATCKDLWQHGTVQSPSMSGTSGQVSGVHPGGNAPSSTPGYVDPRPLTNPPGTNWVDAIAIADDVRQRAEFKRKLGE
jgi:hypothetical protein